MITLFLFLIWKKTLIWSSFYKKAPCTKLHLHAEAINNNYHKYLFLPRFYLELNRRHGLSDSLLLSYTCGGSLVFVKMCFSETSTAFYMEAEIFLKEKIMYSEIALKIKVRSRWVLRGHTMCLSGTKNVVKLAESISENLLWRF